MSPEKLAALIFVVLVIIVIGFLLFLFLPKRLKYDHFKRKWRELQSRVSKKEEWGLAIIEADRLLDEALKKKKIKGKTMGERLVSAQRMFSDNDAVWFGHKLRMKLETNPDLPLRKQDVQKALLGLAQGLKDIGAL
jgi:hypothetical protein